MYVRKRESARARMGVCVWHLPRERWKRDATHMHDTPRAAFCSIPDSTRPPKLRGWRDPSSIRGRPFRRKVQAPVSTQIDMRRKGLAMIE